jgi:glutaredoxin
MYCERGLLLNPNHQGLLRLQIKNYLSHEMNLVGGAEELAVTLVKINAEEQENQLLRGKVAFEQGDYDEAVLWLKKAARSGRLQNSPDIQEAWKLLDMAKGKADELKSSLSMTKELELMMARVKTQAAKGPPKVPAGDGDGGGGGDEAVDPSGGKVVLYMTRWCKYCAKTRDLLKSLKVKFEEKDIEQNQEAMMELMNMAQAARVEVNGVPVVRIGNTLVVGYNPQRIENLIQQAK